MDDTYIHMAMARSFSQYGVWGLTHYAFSSTSSSLLYTLILSAVYKLFGVNEVAPFVLNILFAFSLLFVCDLVLRRAAMSAWPRAGFLAVIIFAMPLAPEVLAGMEHILHTLLTIVFVYYVVQLMLDDPYSSLRRWAVIALAALTVLARYEGLALVAIAAILLFIRGRRLYSCALVFSAAIPIAGFGVYSVTQGWYPVPNSIMAKISRPKTSYFAYSLNWIQQLYDTPAVAFLFLAGLALLFVLYRKRRTIWTSEGLTLGLFVLTTLLHMQFARVGWFYRYEAYLVVLGIYACALGLKALGSSFPSPIGFRNIRLVYGAFVILALISFERRGVGALWLTPVACRNIYQQQYQMGRFLEANYSAESVLMNDIGAAGYLSNSRIVDLYGLSTIEVARAKVRHQFTQDFRRSLALKTDSRIAIVYPDMYKDVGGLPSEWVLVGTWRIPDNQICWGDTVGFYAVNPAYKKELITSLRKFSPFLPPAVIQGGVYTVPDIRRD